VVTAAGSKQFVVFRLGSEDYAFDISLVMEIQSFDAITKVHRSAPYIEGVMNLRGKLVTVVNLRKRFGMEPMPSHESAKIVIVDAPDAPVGFIVDEVAEVVRASPESIEDTPSYVSQNIESEYVLGIIKQGERLVTLVDPIKILALSTGAETGAGGG
jgi:purine-binding chemotaxis protein CheW